ncbi:PKD domain-containing protein [Litoribacter alkaliphilus]|uniref:PKD domain-containing protein n=1 Tax=Litoribacter ruber TaxID=702568 RepID=A0AAP2G3M1_9BACT|nr:PKD domain-containing protein [Litoribacter alkaliphilus]MBS9523595.1 PKD domain-containing protein [Litoribacter alkaliphilus]
MKKTLTSLILSAAILVACNREDDTPVIQANFDVENEFLAIDHDLQFSQIPTRAVQYNWDFGDGQTSSEQNPSGISYENPGNYSITLTTMSEGGSSSSFQKDVQVGRFHAYEITVEQFSPGTIESTDSPFEAIIQVISVNDGNQEVIFESEPQEDISEESLPFTFDVNELALGGNGLPIYDNPLIHLRNNTSQELIAASGYLYSSTVSNSYDFESNEGEFNVATGSILSVKYRLIYPD